MDSIGSVSTIVVDGNARIDFTDENLFHDLYIVDTTKNKIKESLEIDCICSAESIFRMINNKTAQSSRFHCFGFGDSGNPYAFSNEFMMTDYSIKHYDSGNVVVIGLTTVNRQYYAIHNSVARLDYYNGPIKTRDRESVFSDKSFLKVGKISRDHMEKLDEVLTSPGNYSYPAYFDNAIRYLVKLKKDSLYSSIDDKPAKTSATKCQKLWEDNAFLTAFGNFYSILKYSCPTLLAKRFQD